VATETDFGRIVSDFDHIYFTRSIPVRTTIKELRQIIYEEIETLGENMRTPEYMSMTQHADLGGSEESEVEQEASLATLGEKVFLDILKTRDSLKRAVGGIMRMSDHPDALSSGNEMDFANTHADLSMVLDSLEEAIERMR
jgi:molecular chaperone GrpE (heat shock protein)